MGSLGTGTVGSHPSFRKRASNCASPRSVFFLDFALTDCCPQGRIWVVSKGSDALAFLRHEPPFTHVPTPDLIVLDLNLPRPHGRTILAELRRLAAYQATPVVVVSGRDKAVEELRCLELGASAYVQKSSDFATYFDGIRSVMRDQLGTN